MVRGSWRAGGVSLGGERPEHTHSLNLQSLVSILDVDYTGGPVSPPPWSGMTTAFHSLVE